MPYDYFYFKPKKAIRAKGGIKAQSQRGAFAKNWWAQKWIAALERLVDAGRLSRGRSYARRGQVLSIDETKDGIAARVQGSQRAPYKKATGSAGNASISTIPRCRARICISRPCHAAIR